MCKTDDKTEKQTSRLNNMLESSEWQRLVLSGGGIRAQNPCTPLHPSTSLHTLPHPSTPLHTPSSISLTW